MDLKTRARLWWIAVIAAAIDRITKVICVNTLTGGPATVIKGVLSLQYTRNSGIAFSLFASDRGIVTILLTAALLIAIAVYVLKHPETDTLTRAGIWMIIGGGAGNLYDRIAYGSVIDFIRIDLFRFAIFNAADVFVCVGCFMAAIAILLNDFKERKHRGI